VKGVKIFKKNEVEIKLSEPAEESETSQPLETENTPEPVTVEAEKTTEEKPKRVRKKKTEE
jgi:hypothetical protein